MMETKQNSHYNHGIKNNIAFVFSVPGRLELYNNRPIVGETGILLEELMFLLKNDFFQDIDENKKTNRYDYRITNSYPKPIFNEKDNKTEAKNSEIEKENNIKRLSKELEGITDYIFVFGNKAKIAINKINNLKAKIIYERHLGLMSLNQIKKDISGNTLIKGEKGNTKKRLEVIAQNIKSKK